MRAIIFIEGYKIHSYNVGGTSGVVKGCCFFERVQVGAEKFHQGLDAVGGGCGVGFHMLQWAAGLGCGLTIGLVRRTDMSGFLSGMKAWLVRIGWVNYKCCRLCG